jgi:5-methylcytosine-specific restriction endonuclease McrA
MAEAPWCAMPGCGSIERLQLDHIIPLSRGGQSVEGNVRLLCRYHNSQRGGRPKPR